MGRRRLVGETQRDNEILASTGVGDDDRHEECALFNSDTWYAGVCETPSPFTEKQEDEEGEEEEEDTCRLAGEIYEFRRTPFHAPRIGGARLSSRVIPLN